MALIIHRYDICEWLGGTVGRRQRCLGNSIATWILLKQNTDSHALLRALKADIFSVFAHLLLFFFLFIPCSAFKVLFDKFSCSFLFCFENRMLFAFYFLVRFICDMLHLPLKVFYKICLSIRVLCRVVPFLKQKQN